MLFASHGDWRVLEIGRRWIPEWAGSEEGHYGIAHVRVCWSRKHGKLYGWLFGKRFG